MVLTCIEVLIIYISFYVIRIQIINILCNKNTDYYFDLKNQDYNTKLITHF